MEDKSKEKLRKFLLGYLSVNKIVIVLFAVIFVIAMILKVVYSTNQMVNDITMIVLIVANSIFLLYWFVLFVLITIAYKKVKK